MVPKSFHREKLIKCAWTQTQRLKALHGPMVSQAGARTTRVYSHERSRVPSRHREIVVKNQSSAPICLRISQVMERTGLSRAAIERAVRSGQIKSKRVGRAVVLDPDDVVRVFGFSEDRNEIEPSAESVKEIEEFLS